MTSCTASGNRFRSKILDRRLSLGDEKPPLDRLGFEERIQSSHHIFRKAGVEEKINLQREGNKVKVYQVRQVRAVILKYGLRGKE